MQYDEKKWTKKCTKGQLKESEQRQDNKKRSCIKAHNLVEYRQQQIN